MVDTSLFLPDRFDTLQRRAPDQLNSIIVAVDSSLAHIDLLHTDIQSSGQGAFMILRGESGSGKSTFLNTISLFREGVTVTAIPSGSEIGVSLARLQAMQNARLRIVVIEGREALTDTSQVELEKALHSVNAFVRSSAGESTLVVWPCNTDQLEAILVEVAAKIGGESLVGVGGGAYRFSGPMKDQFYGIAQTTLRTLNQGASISDLGVSDEEAKEIIANSATVGGFLKKLRQRLNENKAQVNKLVGKESFGLWVLVIAGGDVEGDVAALTRGSYSSVDTERLLSSTNANIVAELKTYPEKVGILGAVLDAKILHLDITTALSLARTFADSSLRDFMETASLSVAKDSKATERLVNSELGLALEGAKLGTRSRGKSPGSNTVDAFGRLVGVARTQDVLLNCALVPPITEFAG